MSHTLTISDSLYERLVLTARQRGLSVEELLEQWQAQDEELAQRQAAVAHIDALRSQLRTTYGQMPDSTTLLREDRER